MPDWLIAVLAIRAMHPVNVIGYMLKTYNLIAYHFVNRCAMPSGLHHIGKMIADAIAVMPFVYQLALALFQAFNESLFVSCHLDIAHMAVNACLVVMVDFHVGATFDCSEEAILIHSHPTTLAFFTLDNVEVLPDVKMRVVEVNFCVDDAFHGEFLNSFR